jgi:hypothetical protein
MLALGKLVGFLTTTDYERARSFSEGKLGFEFVSLDQFALALRAGKNMIRIPRQKYSSPLKVLSWGGKSTTFVPRCCGSRVATW